MLYTCTFCVTFCGLRFSHILITVVCMQLVHVLHVYSLRLALQCHTFVQYYLVYKLPSLISDLHTAAPMASEALEQEFGYTSCCLVR